MDAPSTATTVVPSSWSITKHLAQLKHDLSDLSNVVEPPANDVDAAAKLFHDASPMYSTALSVSVER